MEQTERKSFLVNFICAIGILGTFATVSLVLAYVGVGVYKNIVAENAQNYKLRTSLSYVATKVRQLDADNKIYIEKREGIDVLVMEQEIENEPYETLIYFYQGHIYEVFHEKGQGLYLPDGGCEILEIDQFTMEQRESNLLYFNAKEVDGQEESITLNLRTRR